MFDAVYVRRTKAEFLLPRTKHYFIGPVQSLQLFGHIQSSIRTAIIDYYHFVVVATVELRKYLVILRLLCDRNLINKLTAITHVLSKYLTISHIMIGRFSRSLYVGSNIEYLSLFVISESTADADMVMLMNRKIKQNMTDDTPPLLMTVVTSTFESGIVTTTNQK